MDNLTNKIGALLTAGADKQTLVEGFSQFIHKRVDSFLITMNNFIEGHGMLTIPYTFSNDSAGAIRVDGEKFMNATLNGNSQIVAQYVANESIASEKSVPIDVVSDWLSDQYAVQMNLADLVDIPTMTSNSEEINSRLASLAEKPLYTVNAQCLTLIESLKTTSQSISSDESKMNYIRALVGQVLNSSSVDDTVTADSLAQYSFSPNQYQGISPFAGWCSEIDLNVSWSSFIEGVKSTGKILFSLFREGMNTLSNTLNKVARKVIDSTVDPQAFVRTADKFDYDGLNDPVFHYAIPISMSQQSQHLDVTTDAMRDRIVYTMGQLGIDEDAVFYFSELVMKYEIGVVYNFTLPGLMINIYLEDRYESNPISSNVGSYNLHVVAFPKLFSKYKLYDRGTGNYIYNDPKTIEELQTVTVPSIQLGWTGTSNYSTSEFSEDHHIAFGFQSGWNVSTGFADMILSEYYRDAVNNNDAPADEIFFSLGSKGNWAINSTGTAVEYYTSQTLLDSLGSYNDSGFYATHPTTGVKYYPWYFSNNDGCWLPDTNYWSLVNNGDGSTYNSTLAPVWWIVVCTVMKESSLFIPYWKSATKSIGSISLVADSEQAGKFRSFLRIVGIAAATVVATVAFVKIRGRLKNSLAANTAQLQYATRSWDGSAESTANIRKLTRKNNMLSKIIGASSTAASSTLTSLPEIIKEQESTKYDQIYRLIAGDYPSDSTLV